MKNDTICKQNGSTVFLKEREQYFEIQDLKAQLQDKAIDISELKRLIEKCKGKSVETKFDKRSVVRQLNALRVPKPSVLGKSTPFSDSLKRKSFKTTKSVTKTNVSEGLTKQVTTQILPQTARQAVRNINVIKPGMYQHKLEHHSFLRLLGILILACLPLQEFGGRIQEIYLLDTASPTPICFMAKASPTQAWLWHRRISHLNFDTIKMLSKKDIVNGLPKLKYIKDQLCSSCELSKAKRNTFKTKTVPSSKGWLNLLHMDLCGPMRIASINGKKYILVIVDDYS
ncbi:retrovirus-related pol polyprotein from transposon TNT 1-94 [Tanacetum coccineum]